MKYEYEELSLAIMLAENKKADLAIKANILGIKALSGLNKEKLANKVADHILQNPINFLDKIPVEDVLKLHTIINSKNHEYPISPRLLTNNSLMEFGVVDTSIPWVDMETEETMFIYKDFAEALIPVIDDYVASAECQDRKEREEIVLGILNLYGIVPLPELDELYSFYRPCCDKLCETVCNSYLFTCNSRMDDITHIPVLISPFLFDYSYTDTCQREYAHIPKEIFTLEEVRAAGSFSFPLPIIKEGEALLKLLRKTGSTIQEANELLSNVWVLINNDQNPGEVIFQAFNMNTREMPTANLHKLLEIYSEVINHLPSWKFKGRSADYVASLPTERKERIIKTSSAKTNLNDACPCGSGKRYKLCCGNN